MVQKNELVNILRGGATGENLLPFFTVGTLEHHVESGEELFQVIMAENGQVFYEIQAFSRPRFWMVRLAYPLARYFQRQFVKDSLKNMKKVTDGLLKTQPQLVD
jgi:uncharacterized protein (UPF0548 family)